MAFGIWTLVFWGMRFDLSSPFGMIVVLVFFTGVGFYARRLHRRFRREDALKHEKRRRERDGNWPR